MTEPLPQSEGSDEPPPTPPPPRRGHRWKLIVLLVLLTPVALFAIFTAGALTWSYSEGQRAGYLQKLSRKGWLCKTWEGELAMTTVPGVAPTIWEFTVRNENTAHQLNLALGRRVVMFYEEHRGIPSRCFGETNYFVDSVRIVK